MIEQKQNILFVGNPSDVHNIKWMSFFTKRGNKVVLLCEKSDGKRISEKTFNSLRENTIQFAGNLPNFSFLNPFSICLAFWKLRSTIGENKIDVVHFLFGTHALFGLLIKKPFIITTRGSDILLFIPQFIKKNWTGKLWKFFYSASYSKADYITCTSYKQRTKVIELFNAENNKVRVIRTGVDVETIAKVDSSNLPMELVNTKYIFMPRYLRPVYNNELIIESLILNEIKLSKDFVLVFIKDNSADENYILKTLKPLDHTSFKYFVFQELSQAEIWSCFKYAQLTIMTPLSDGTPNTALEAMSAKCPLILGEYDYDNDLFSNVCLRLKENKPHTLAETIVNSLNNYPSELIEKAYERVSNLGNRQVEMLKVRHLYQKLYYRENKQYIDPMLVSRPYRICTNCIMDTNDDPDIFFDEAGTCNHCNQYLIDAKNYVITGERGSGIIKETVEKIKSERKTKKYDCILGVSGGVDSSYLAILAKELGLNVLCVHLDNGWNSETAVSNINNLVKYLKFDLYTYVLDWEEFKDLQLSYLKASVLDLEVPTDHAMLACLHKIARKEGIKYILSGHNIVTEAVLPKSFNFDKADTVNILNIHKKFGSVKLKTFPIFNQRHKLLNKFYYKHVSIRFLNNIDYNKQNAINILKEKIGWKEYGVKHGESIFTKFYQNYILPQKFHINKKKAHLSNLICSGQISRQEALEELNTPLYKNGELNNDIDYVIKKWGITRKQFEEYMNAAPIAHEFYGIEIPFSDKLWAFRFIKLLIKNLR